jgi:hypothetical protein
LSQIPEQPNRSNPSRFEVKRQGPDPDGSIYYVVDIVYDQYARVAMQRLASLYRNFHQREKAEHIEWLLDKTKESHFSFIDAKYPKRKK